MSAPSQATLGKGLGSCGAFFGRPGERDGSEFSLAHAHTAVQQASNKLLERPQGASSSSDRFSSYGAKEPKVLAPSTSPSSTGGCSNAAGGNSREFNTKLAQFREAAQNRQRVEAQGFLSTVRAKAHESHTVQGNLELGWCSKCGSMVSLGDRMRLYKLAARCEPAGARGKQNLREISLGVNPLQKRRFLH